MTDIEQKALALLRECAEVPAYMNLKAIPGFVRAALFRAIEQHEAFRQEVSDAVAAALDCGDVERLRREGILSRFIIAKPDPLVEALAEATGQGENYIDERDAAALRAAIEKRGGKIVWGEKQS